MVIGLLGFPFSDSNKGCEALTYSFIEVLRELVEEDFTIINLWGNDVKTVSEFFPTINFEGVEFKRSDITFRATRALIKCDIVFDATFGDNFSDIYSLDFVNKTTFYKELALFFGRPLVLAPQTLGPFKDEKLKNRAIKILRKSKLVFSRDQISTEYVKNIAGIDAVTVTDLAFMLPYNKDTSRNDRTKIGLNVSGLLWKGGFSKDNQFGLTVDYKEYICSLIEKLKEMQNVELHLIPHVIATSQLQHDDDVDACMELSHRYDVTCAPAFNNPVEAKSYISCMDVFTGARMHSTIAAFSSGVITIPFSYSRKFEGLYNSLNYNFIINGRTETTESAVEKTLDFMKNNQQLQEQQYNALNRVKLLQGELYSNLNILLK